MEGISLEMLKVDKGEIGTGSIERINFETREGG
jgi:hypothetical protein